MPLPTWIIPWVSSITGYECHLWKKEISLLVTSISHLSWNVCGVIWEEGQWLECLSSVLCYSGNSGGKSFRVWELANLLRRALIDLPSRNMPRTIKDWKRPWQLGTNRDESVWCQPLTWLFLLCTISMSVTSLLVLLSEETIWLVK